MAEATDPNDPDRELFPHGIEVDGEICAPGGDFIKALKEVLRKHSETGSGVPPSYIIETALLPLVAELVELSDGYDAFLSPETKKLLKAMAEYSGSNVDER